MDRAHGVLRPGGILAPEGCPDGFVPSWVFASTVPEQGSVDDSIGVEHRHGDDAVSLPFTATPATGLTLWAVMAIIGIAMVGAAIRVAALLPIGAADQFPVDYDEGVYSAAASLFARGQMPYRDFFFVHPPGARCMFCCRLAGSARRPLLWRPGS